MLDIEGSLDGDDEGFEILSHFVQLLVGYDLFWIGTGRFKFGLE